MIDLSKDDSIIGYLSWAEANNISPFGNDIETNIYDDMFDNEEVEEKIKVKKKNKNNFGGHNG